MLPKVVYFGQLLEYGVRTGCFIHSVWTGLDPLVPSTTLVIKKWRESRRRVMYLGANNSKITIFFAILQPAHLLFMLLERFKNGILPRRHFPQVGNGHSKNPTVIFLNFRSVLHL